MNRTPRHLVLMGLAALLVPQGRLAFAQSPRDTIDDPRAHAEALRAERRAAAVPSQLVSPLYSVRDGREARLFVLNTTSDAVRFDLSALDPNGEVLPLGSHQVKPTRHLELDLTRDLKTAGGPFQEGSLWLRYLGDDESLQAWLVIRRQRQVIEIPLQSSADFNCRSFAAFWHTASAGPATDPVVTLVNRGTRPVEARLSIWSGNDLHAETAKSMLPGTQWRFQPDLSSGWMRLDHDGDPGDVIGSAVVESASWLSAIPLWQLPMTRIPTDFESTILPIPDPGAEALSRADLSVFNLGRQPQEVRIELLSSASGAPILVQHLRVETREVVSWPLTAMLRRALGSSAAHGFRLRVAADGPEVLLVGAARLTSGEVLDFTFFPSHDAHAGGSYPLPPLAQYDVYFTIVNLDRQDSEIVGQIWWAGGSYSIGPIRIAGRASETLRIRDLGLDPPPDLLGRTLDPEYSAGFLKWIVQSGSRRLIARTEVRPLDTEDRVGFNCFGCCWVIPYGSVEPGFVSFEPGQSPLFQACVNYETCEAGDMGPYSTTMTSQSVPSPFSWNGVNVSASTASSNELSFVGEEELIEVNCETYDFPFEGVGTASSCKVLLRKAHNPAQSWQDGEACTLQLANEPVSARCSRCQACCGAQRNFRLCNRKNSDVVEREYRVCLTHCDTDHCL